MFEVRSFIGKGAQHSVGETEDGSLIKIPHWKGKIWDKSTAETIKEDLKLLKEHQIPIPKTEVVENPQIDTGKSILNPPYIIIAERIHGKIFRELNLKDPSVIEQITHITRQSLEIRRKTKAAIDFLGGEVLKEFIRYLFRECLDTNTSELITKLSVLLYLLSRRIEAKRT